MKKLSLYCCTFLITIAASAQIYLRGIIRDEKNKPVVDAKINFFSTKATIKSDIDGSFGITTSFQYDSITVSKIGYEDVSLKVKSDVWQNILLKLSSDNIVKTKPKLTSIIKSDKRQQRFNPFISDETYFQLVENEFINANDFPLTSFSLNINKASYSNIRRFINMNSKVPPDAVRIEEMVNYFNIGCEKPTANNVFNIKSSIGICPWNNKNELLFLKLCARKIDINKLPAGNFVFLIDVSGSMDMPNRLPLVKEAFQLFVKNLRPIDMVSIVTYGGVVGTWLPPTSGSEKQKINDRIEMLEAAGDTPGASAIEETYKMARANFLPNGNNRVILATDGDFNVGPISEKALDELITKQRESGIFLTCLGVGMGNFKDSKLQTLAKRGNGNYAYLDNLHEAEKVLVKELTETLYAVAENAFIQIKFNPKAVSNYRLIGFDNKKEAVQDASSEIEGGEIGSGSNSIAIFEIAPTAEFSLSPFVGNLKLKFHDTKAKPGFMEEMNYDIPSSLSDTSDVSVKFASAVATLGLKLKESPYANNLSWKTVKATADAAVDKSILLQADFLKLVYKCIGLYEPIKKPKRNKLLN